MPGTRVFVSGVAGFLGSHLAEALLDAGHRVVGCDNLVGGARANVPRGVEFHECDLNDHARLRPLVRGAEVVYHTAALAHEGLSLFSPHLVTTSIFGATVSLTSAAIAAGARRFVFFSSMARYGAGPVPFVEELPPRPVDPYGVAKVAAEQAIATLCRTHAVEHVVVVPHNVIGPRQKYDDPYRNVVAIMMNLMLQGRQPVIYGDGKQRRCFSYVGDLRPMFEPLGFQANLDGEVINVGPDDEFVTINELAAILAELMGFDLDPVHLPARPGEVEEANCSAEKARRLLGYRTRYDLRGGLALMLDWMRARGARPFRYHLDLEIPSPLIPPTWADRLL
ncbi:MAG: NAD-dependent epimerase/dehydratase family protein [Candidatus Rokuibacteriota bacterium]